MHSYGAVFNHLDYLRSPPGSLPLCLHLISRTQQVVGGNRLWSVVLQHGILLKNGARFQKSQQPVESGRQSVSRKKSSPHEATIPYFSCQAGSKTIRCYTLMKCSGM